MSSELDDVGLEDVDDDLKELVCEHAITLVQEQGKIVGFECVDCGATWEQA